MGQLQPVSFPAPGFFGLNRREASVPIGPEWAAEAKNAVVDDAGRVACRKGWVATNASAIQVASNPATIYSLHEQVGEDGTSTVIAVAHYGSTVKLFGSANNGSTWSDITGAATVTQQNNWQFANFAGKVIGCNGTDALLVRSTGNFSAVAASSGSVPTTPTAVLSAFGRVWTISGNGQTLSYSALLDETKWAEADGAGVQDIGLWWTRGTDQAVALAAFGATLVVFGKRHIFLLTDGQGSDRGLDPSTMFIEDTLENVGCVAPRTIQPMGEGDLLFLSQTGVRSLLRVVQEKRTPLNDLSANVREFVVRTTGAGEANATGSFAMASPENGFYLLTTPATVFGTGSGRTFCFDTRTALPDGSLRVFDWPGFIPRSSCRLINGDVLFGWTNGYVGRYEDYSDNGSAYRFEFRSGFLDLGPEMNVLSKALKRVKLHTYSPGGSDGPLTVNLSWAWDFKQPEGSVSLVYTPDDGASLPTDGNTLEYAGAFSQHIDYFPASGTGQYFSLGITANILYTPLSINAITAFFVPLRLA